MYENPKLILDSSQPLEPGEIVWRSPSNIAIVKYWGKYGQQLPRNPSLSLTLTASYTETQLSYSLKEANAPHGIDLDFYFHGEEKPAFKEKIVAFLTSLLPTFPFLNQLSLQIDTGNSFPHSAGIASSASAMSALSLCLCTLEHRLFQTLGEDNAFDQKASYLSRLGSGSACRSIYPYAATWGENSLVPTASNEFASPIGDYLHPVFKNMHDDILIVSKSEKSVSSRAGHQLMEMNPYSEPRYAQAKAHMVKLFEAMQSGDLETFGNIAEQEALTLHALMMTSNPSYILMEPNSLAIIAKIRKFRAETGLPVYFTLDAGPNIHVLYPEEHVAAVRSFILAELISLCENNMMIQDWVGEGPEEL